MKNNWLLWSTVLLSSVLSCSVFAESAAQDAAATGVDMGKLVGVVGLAFIGGIILNLMPCVFPVLSIKILGFVQHAGEGSSAAIKHALVYTLGILLSFWVLTAIMLAIRAGGDAVGVGFQLQSPVVLVVLIYLLFLFALNLFGVFELGTSLTTMGGDAIHKSGLSGSFFSGLLATVLGAPCVGPFLGTSLGYTMTQPNWVVILVFSVLGLGLAFPFVLLAAVPGLAKYMPRPGRWMESFKMLMGFPLALAAVWLLYVLAASFLPLDIEYLLYTLVVVGLAAWVYGRWSVPGNSEAVRWVAKIFSLVVVAGSLAYWAIGADDKAALAKVKKEDEIAKVIDKALRENASLVGSNSACSTPVIKEKREAAKQRGEIFWEDWSEDYVKQLVDKGCPVYIDFTADWCVICKVNKKRVFGSEAVVKRFHELGIITLIGDNTEFRDDISEILEVYERPGVPLNLLYTKGAEPYVFPESFGADEMMEALDKMFN